jgi:hypothetical protein
MPWLVVSVDMDRPTIEQNPLTRFVFGLLVIAAMMLGGRVVGEGFLALGVPYGDWIGVGVGAILVFVVVAVLYSRSE